MNISQYFTLGIVLGHTRVASRVSAMSCDSCTESHISELVCRLSPAVGWGLYAQGGWTTGPCVSRLMHASLQVAEAPKVHMARDMHALRDLEGKGVQSVRQHLADKFGPEIDFSVLLSCLLPEDQLEEKEEFWDENLLLTEVVSELETLKDSQKDDGSDCP